MNATCRSTLASLLISLLLVACGEGGSTDPGAADAPPGSGADAAAAADAAPTDPPVVAAAIALCYEALQGDTSKRGDALDALKAATEAEPDSARAFLFLGMCSLSALAEDTNLLVANDVLPALERAYELDPTDLRIPGWIGSVKVRMATLPIIGSEEAEVEAIAYMIAAADLYPDFNNVSLAIAFSAGFGLDTPYPQMAIDRLEAITACVATDPACTNLPTARHNVQGSMMLFADVYARIGDAAQARQYYELALASEGADTWPYRADAETALAELDDRIERFTDGNSFNDPTFFALGQHSCRGCHE